MFFLFTNFNIYFCNLIRFIQILITIFVEEIRKLNKKNTMQTITTQSLNKLRADISYLKETATVNELLSGEWMDGLSKSSQNTFDLIKSISSVDYSTISLAMDILNNKTIKF